jgi:hypothetical protein
MRYACEAYRFGIIIFWTASECLRERAYDEVQIRSKFQWYNPNVLQCTISGVQSENNGVMLSKFYPDLNWTSRHKHDLSVTLG